MMAGQQAPADKEAIKTKMWEKMAESPFLMVGLMGEGRHEHSEPLTAQLDKDQVDTIFFFAGKDNRAAGGGIQWRPRNAGVVTALRGLAPQSPRVSSDALPPAAVVLTVTVFSVAKRGR